MAKLNPNDLSTYPIQPKPCKTCPFAGEKPIQLAPQSYARYIDNLLGKGQHLCHSVNNQMICAGGREIQLRWLYLKGYISEPTNEAFKKASKEALKKVKQND